VKQSLHANVSFDMSVCSSILTEQLGFHWTDFHELLCWEFLLKSVNQIKIWPKKKTGILHEDLRVFIIRARIM